MGVSAVIVTRGDVDLKPILTTLPYRDIVVWDNSKRAPNLGLYGRFAGIEEAKNDIIYVQDDDLLCPHHDALAAGYEPGKIVTVAQEDIVWVGRGSLFHRDLPELAFRRYLEHYPFDKFFRDHACDGIFGLLTPATVLPLACEPLPHGEAGGRVSTTPGWYEDRRPEIRRRCEALTS